MLNCRWTASAHHSPSNTFINISSLVDCAMSVSLQKSHSRGDTGCFTQRRSNAYQFMMWPIPLYTASSVQPCYLHRKLGHTKTAWICQYIHGSYVAGSSACNNVDDTNRACATHGNSGGPSSTSWPRKWGVPTKSRKEPTQVKRLEMTTPIYRKVPQHIHPSDIQPLILNFA